MRSSAVDHGLRSPSPVREQDPVDSRLAVIDDAMRELAHAEEELCRGFEPVLSSVSPEDHDHPELSSGLVGRLEGGLSGRTGVERRLLALLAFRQAQSGGTASRAADLAQRALGGGRLLADGIRSPALMAAGMALGAANHTQAAERLFDAIVDQAQRTGSWAVLAAARGQRGLERYRRGGLYEAMFDLHSALDVSSGQPWETLVDDGRAHLLRVQVEQGELALADRNLEVWGASGPLPDTAFGNRLLIERGRLRLAQDRPSEASADLQDAARRLSDQKDSILFEWRETAALAYHRLGEQDLALTLAHEELERATGWGAHRQLGSAMLTLGLIEGGAPGIERIEGARDLLDGSSAVLERARAMVALGLLLRRAGEPGRARSELAGGKQIASRCGASALVQIAEHEIAASGERRRRRTLLSGPEALTPTERRVASLAATGLSNPDIARRLYVTRKTVEMHLGNAYRKLRINSRADLQSALSPTSINPRNRAVGWA
jgi:DNA-binding CsgD family transcriptional regulator